MVTLGSVDHILRPTLDVRHRAELHRHLTDLAGELHAHDRGAIDWTQRRRQILDQIQHAHDLLWDLDCFHGRRPARPGEPPLPPTSDDPMYLTGRRLRTTCLALLRTHGRRSLPELHTLLHLHGYAVYSRSPTRALADAMALEVR